MSDPKAALASALEAIGVVIVGIAGVVLYALVAVGIPLAVVFAIVYLAVKAANG